MCFRTHTFFAALFFWWRGALVKDPSLIHDRYDKTEAHDTAHSTRPHDD